MRQEPIAGVLDHRFERPRFFKKVGRAGHDDELLFASCHFGECRATESQHPNIDTTQWLPRLNRKDFTVALNFTGNGIDDPDQNFYENYVCGAEGNYIKYCNAELDKLVDRQSMEANQDKRKALV
jgi:hypothetical protein